jgi:UDP-2,3-diacylglucosamine pyrophosphatase LpxH
VRVDYVEQRLLVVSDLHIGNPFSQARRLLQTFFRFVEDSGFSLCINGDGLDIAQTSFARLANELPEVLDGLRRIARRNGSVYYVVGNHDIHLNHFLADWGVVTVLPFLNLRSGDSRIRIEHGHLYDPFFVNHPRAYELATELAGGLLRVSPSLYNAWIWYETVRNRLLAKVSRGGSILANEHPAFTEAARDLLRRGFDAVVFGHTHVPGALQVDGAKIYCNAGSWMVKGNYVMIENGEVGLRRWRH